MTKTNMHHDYLKKPPTATTQHTPKLDALIADLANDLREMVEKIEARPMTTRGHYGDYMSLISSTTSDRPTARIVALALKEAGANVQGVQDALQICGHA